MKRLITDEELMAYVSAASSREETRALKKKAIDNGETGLLLYATLTNYAAHKDLADELLGIDEFEVENLRKATPFDNFSHCIAADKKKPKK